MKITICGQDYSSALDAAHPLTIERKLNEPSVCRLWITLSKASSSTIERGQSLRILGDDGTFYFTGYVAATPLPEYAGLGVEGPRYRIGIEAVSDECLLDQAGIAPTRGPAGMAAGPLIAELAAKTGCGALSTDGLSLDAPVAQVAIDGRGTFSSAAGSVADQVRAAYRALNGSLALSSLPAAVHPLEEGDGILAFENLRLNATTKRALANDITVCGEHEPTTYVTEYFLGDGVTTQFNLSDRVFAPAGAESTLISELFNEGQLDLRRWGYPGANGFIALGAGGLLMQGGTGVDGETQLAWRDAVEMGGTLLLEAGGVVLEAGSTGVLAGFFVGDNAQSSCTVGFQATAQQGSGRVTIQPLVLGLPAGAAYQVNQSNQYALRVRVHCPECYRNAAIYRTCDDSGAVAVGGGLSTAPADLHFEIQEFVNGVAGMPVTLYEDRIADTPSTCRVVAASSIDLHGSIRALNLTQLGSGWVRTMPANGSPTTRRVGAASQSAECVVEESGRLVFYPGFVPAAGEQIAVSYRTVRRAAGRAVNSASQQKLADAGLPSVSRWIGTVTSPQARSSCDCRSAASALEKAAASVSALWSGTYRCTNLGVDADVWPGDALAIDAPSMGLKAEVMVRAVKLTYRASLPDVVDYEINFANDWASDLAIKTSSSVPDDAWLPAPVSPHYLANLNGLTVVDVSGQAITIHTGTTAPAGGGFEIRRRDNCFMAATDADLVIRSSQPTMSYSRFSVCDRFYVRAFDGQNPPNYSEFSAALIFNLPLAS